MDELDGESLTACAIEQVRDRGFAILPAHLSRSVVDRCRDGFRPHWEAFFRAHPASNRGAHRYFLPMPFEESWFPAGVFAEPAILAIVGSLMDDRIVADQWGCDVPVSGSEYQRAHVDYARPLFAESPDLILPPYALVMSFGLGPIGLDDGPIEIAPGTHRWTRSRADRAIDAGTVDFEPVVLAPGDVLIRHPWALHRGTPNRTDTPRFLVSIRYVRRWYVDGSREVRCVPLRLWESLPAECREVMRFPIG